MEDVLIEKKPAIAGNSFSGELQKTANELLQSGEVELFIGYEEGTRFPRPCFIASTDEVGKLIFDDRCTGNLAVYLTRKDLIGDKKVGITASYFALRSILRLLTEHQIQLDKLVVLTVSAEKEVIRFATTDDITAYLQTAPIPVREDDKALIEKLNAMSREERWEFWSAELSKCFKCYACRAACPMCYCTKCIVEENRPQWIQPWASTLANIEWHINRAMHMTGRCADCGACGAACPLGLPIHLLSHQIVQEVTDNFALDVNQAVSGDNALSTFKPEDKENFIK
ncbi:MAG: 4Fe-4S binding domain protein [Bacteroidetes bacterium]|nr:4Fe-4S binding domain protein [Bacteroidota bacterium]